MIKAIEDRIIRDIQNIFEQEEDYKQVTTGNYYIYYIEYESNMGDRSKILSINEYLDETKPYLKDIINNLKKFDTWKI